MERRPMSINRALPRKLAIVREALLSGTLLSIPATTEWTSAVDGSAVTATYPGTIEAGTGTTAGSTARIYAEVLNFPGTNFPIDFSKRIIWGFTVRRVTSNAALLARVQLKAATTEGVLAARGIGIRMDDMAIAGESYESAGAFTGTIQAMTGGIAYHILVDHEPAVPRTRFYVNGVLQATVTATANVPTTAITDGLMMVSIFNGTTANGYVQVGAVWIYVAL